MNAEQKDSESLLCIFSYSYLSQAMEIVSAAIWFDDRLNSNWVTMTHYMEGKLAHSIKLSPWSIYSLKNVTGYSWLMIKAVLKNMKLVWFCNVVDDLDKLGQYILCGWSNQYKCQCKHIISIMKWNRAHFHTFQCFLHLVSCFHILCHLLPFSCQQPLWHQRC